MITGVAGFIGSHLAEAAIARGDEVIGIDCFTDYYDRSLKETNLEQLHHEDRFRFVEADLRTTPLRPILEGADIVINQAATPGLVLSWDDFDEYQSNNFTAVKRLIDAALEAGIEHVIHGSTSSVYGVDATGGEDSPTRPVSPYGVTKLAAENLLYAYHLGHGLPLTILRYFSVYGPRQRPDMAYRIFCERLLDGKPITIYGDGRQSRSNTHVFDVVEATLAASEQPGTGEIYNIGGGQELELLEAVEILGRVLETEPEIRFEEQRRGDQRRTMALIDKAESRLGWTPQIEPEQGLPDEADWVRSMRSC